jgi:hypothetical protein
MDDAQKGRLRAAKLTVLARSAGFAGESIDFAGGAALVDEASHAAWLLINAVPTPLPALGPALVWADRRGATEIDLVIDSAATPLAAIFARRAALFSQPPRVWAVAATGNELGPLVAAPPPVAVPAPSAPALAEILVDADLEVVVENGIVRGEVRGLEVARIVHGTTTAGMPIDEPIIEVGVGHADREMTLLVHAALAPEQQIARVKEIVLEQRHGGAERHPLNQLAPERWLRSQLQADPARIGLASLRAVEGSVPRPNLRDRSIAYGVGTRPDGETVVVACSVGIDLDLVPAAADARLMHAPEAPLLLVLPARDAHPVTRDLAERLVRPAAVVTVDDDWRESSPH